MRSHVIISLGVLLLVVASSPAHKPHGFEGHYKSATGDTLHITHDRTMTQNWVIKYLDQAFVFKTGTNRFVYNADEGKYQIDGHLTLVEAPMSLACDAPFSVDFAPSNNTKKLNLNVNTPKEVRVVGRTCLHSDSYQTIKLSFDKKKGTKF